MVFYELRIRAPAETELRAIPFPFRRQLSQRIFKLRDDPHLPTARRGDNGLGAPTSFGRISYDVDDNQMMVCILGFSWP